MREIEELKRQLAEIQTKIEELEKETQFEKLKMGKEYFTIHCGSQGTDILRWIESNDEFDESFYNNNNYFHTKERAEEAAKNIRVLLKLWRLHDTLCEDYVSNWDEEEAKWIIFYSYSKETWCEEWWVSNNYNLPCFPTKELAQKACDILNVEGFRP